MAEKIIGTLAIDLGNTNTVVAFQGEKSSSPILLDMPSITKSPGIVPTAIWFEEDNAGEAFIGTKALNMINENNKEDYFYSNFKRLIGNPNEDFPKKYLTPEEAGEKFFKRLWDYIPEIFIIKRLVLTAPIDTYKGYRRWLVNICNNLPIKEIALVDEPTAAAIGINVPFGSKIMIIDIGGSTIDLNIVKIEGGEGKAAPIAELLKFNGKDVSEISKQKLRCAEIISKSGCKLGGKDFDKWIAEYFVPLNKDSRNLSIAETIKCHLSEENIKSDQQYIFSFFVDDNEKKEFKISKSILEEILISNNLIKLLSSLLKNLLNDARGKDCKRSDLWSVILVGGGTQIPLIRNWIRYKLPEVTVNYPPPIESISLGALSLTPGVKIKDILLKGLLIRLFNKRENKHFWHPIFYKGQTWPTEKPFELILQPSNKNQVKFEIIIGETLENNDFDIIFEDGIPKLTEIQKEENVKIKAWNRKPLMLRINSPAILGKDCLKLVFNINHNSNLLVECKDYSDKKIGVYNLGSIL